MWLKCLQLMLNNLPAEAYWSACKYLGFPLLSTNRWCGLAPVLVGARTLVYEAVHEW